MSKPVAGWKPNLYVLARFLEYLWRRNQPTLKTRLQVAAGVNYDLFGRYLAWMQDRGLVVLETASDGHERVFLTQKGQEAYRKLVQWIQEVVEGKMPGG